MSGIGSWTAPADLIWRATISKSRDCAAVIGSTPMPPEFTLFDTKIGLCGIAWNDAGIFCTQLPEGDAGAFASAIPAARARRARSLTPAASACGDRPDRCAARRRQGRRLHRCRARYGAGCPISTARSTRSRARFRRARPSPMATSRSNSAACSCRAMLARPWARIRSRSSCRVIASLRRVRKPGGFSARGGTATKLKMLAIEGAYVNHTPSLFDEAPARNARH